MKRLVLLYGFLFSLLTIHANESDRISLGVFISNEPQTIPTEAASMLETRMKKAVVADGFADDNATGRFTLVGKCDILEKDIAPTMPPRISQKIEISFLVVDIIENKIYGSCEMTVSGIGTNETKAFNTAFQKVNPQNKHLKEMLADSKEKILEYYTLSCPQIITQARTWASTGKFDEAIFSLMSVPPVCDDCYKKCQELACELYQEKINSQCTILLETAKNKWSASKTGVSAIEIAEILNQIDPRSTNYNDVVSFRQSVEQKLDADEKRNWDFKMKQYEDNQAFKRSIVDACRSVGEIFAKNFQLPQINFFSRR